jgi:phthalate 4,5-dioxygenase oxygenase subunit
MAIKPEDNKVLTDSGPDTPMGKMLRQYWAPAIRSDALERDGPPVRVMLFGQKFVAFRGTDGHAGFIDEACPHRGVSLALARNEENGLRCIFHGWKIEVSGAVVDAPCEPKARRENFCKHIRVSRYAVREASGVVWVFLGDGPAPQFPDFEFNTLPPENVCIRRAVVPYNWVQGVEAHIDSSHVAFLHSGFLTKNRDRLDTATADNLAAMMVDKTPRFETEVTPYGLKESALRNMGEGKTYARIREIVLPFYTFIPGPEEGPYGGRMSVPIDDETSAEWYILYSPDRPLSEIDISSLFSGTSSDPDNFAANMGSEENLWNQDRSAMKGGHFSGLTKNLSFEDFIVQASMGSRIDRSKEQLGSSDAIIVKVRRMLLEAAQSMAEGHGARWTSGFSYKFIRARSVTYEASRNWREFSPALGSFPASPEPADAVTK